jgi:hypothetical protein
LAAALPVVVEDPTTATNPAKHIGTTILETAFDYSSSYLKQHTLPLQKEIAGHLVSVGYVGNLGRHLTEEAQINQPSNYLDVFPIPSLTGTTITQREGGGISEYNAFQLQFQRRFSRAPAVNANYNQANSTGNTVVTDEGGAATGYCFGWCPEDNPANPSQPIIVHG